LLQDIDVGGLDIAADLDILERKPYAACHGLRDGRGVTADAMP
jgi:hypothetical protein